MHSVVVWISGIVICSEVSHFLSIVGCISNHGSILDIGVDAKCGILHLRQDSRVKRSIRK
jgi:hypothetical protein